MRASKCKQVIDFDKSTTTDKEGRNRTLQQQMPDKYNRIQVVTLSEDESITKPRLKVCSHLASFSQFDVSPFNGPFFCFYSKYCVYKKRKEKWTEWVVNPLC